MNTKIYTIVGGVNGAGKSSLTGVLKAERSDLGYIIDVDKIAAEHNGDNLKAGRIAIAKMQYFIEHGISFTQETTLSGYMVEKNIQRAKDAGYSIHLFYVGLGSAEESLLRIQNRVRKGGHNIPEDDVLRRFQNRFQALVKILPYCDEVKFYDNENQFANVAEYRNGELIFKSDYHPGWLLEFQQYLGQDEEMYMVPELTL